MKRFTQVLAGAVLLVLLVGCATAPNVRFYTLSATASPVAGPKIPPDLSLAVGPVDVPEYLDRPQIVTRIGASELAVHEFQRWAGMLQEEATRAVARNLASLLGTRKVHLYPSRTAAAADLRVVIELRGFEGTPGSTVTLDAAWSILDERRAEVVHTGFTTHSAVSGTGFDAYARALSETLAALSRDIARELQRTAAGGT
jgi:uncharacterized lipoprotein YmbA